MKFIVKFVIILFLGNSLYAQEPSKFDDLQAIKNETIIFYNIEGYTITTQNYSSPFTDKKLKPIYRQYKIKRKKYKPETDPLLSVKHYRYVITEKIDEKLTSYYSAYFIENKGKTSVISFAGYTLPSNDFMNAFVKKFLANDFAKEIYAAPQIDSIKFVNRHIKLGPGCHWMGVRNVQCPYNGQMDWSIHKSLKQAKEFTQIREHISTTQRKLKVVSKDSISIQFEGKKTKALKAVYDIKGFKSLLLGLQSGAKHLIVYYIAEEIKGKNISCILSHWDNDKLQPNGLPALLGEVMDLNKK